MLWHGIIEHTEYVILTKPPAYGAACCVAGGTVSSMSEVVVGACSNMSEVVVGACRITLAAFVGRLFVRGGPAAPHSQVGCTGHWVAVGSWGAFGPQPPAAWGACRPPHPLANFINISVRVCSFQGLLRSNMFRMA